MGELNLAHGFRFKPTDEELISYYLKPKVMGQVLPCNIIKTVQLYGPDSSPWQLFDLDDPDKSFYVFTSLSKISTDPNNTTMKSRFNTSKRAGCGTWAQKTQRKPIWDRNGNVIGGKRMLVFVINDIGVPIDSSKAVYFKMHEYSLWGVNESLCSDLVLCHIAFDSSRKSAFKLAVEKTNHVSRKGSSKAPKKAQNKNNLETGAGETLKTVAVMNSEESRSLNSDDLVAIYDGVVNGDQSDVAAALDNMGVQDLDEFDAGLNFDCLGGDGNGDHQSDVVAALDNMGVQHLDEFDAGLNFDCLGGESLCLDDLGSEDISLESFDIAGFMRYLDSNQEEEPLVDRTNHNLGKRTLEEGDDHSCQAKKMCIR